MRYAGQSAGWGLARWVLGAAIVVGAVTMTVHADWTVVNLQPAGATASYALGVQGGQQTPPPRAETPARL